MTSEELVQVEEAAAFPHMTSEELVQAGEAAFGHQWKNVFVKELEVTISTVNRWVSGYTPISRVNELAIKALIATAPLRNKETVDA